MKLRRRDQLHDSLDFRDSTLGGKGATQQGDFQYVVGIRPGPRDSIFDIFVIISMTI